MGWIRRNRSVVWFIIFFLLAGIANLLSRTANPVIDTLMTCIRIRRGEQEKAAWDERLLLIPAAALSLLVITNDLHRLVYDPLAPLDLFQIDTGTYTLGPCFYVLYVLTFTPGTLVGSSRPHFSLPFPQAALPGQTHELLKKAKDPSLITPLTLRDARDDNIWRLVLCLVA